jgi:flagella basal body P-ring formation protein FlgA
MIRLIFATILLSSGPVAAEVVVAVNTVRAKAIIMPEDLGVSSGDMAGGFENVDDVVGLEARVVLYAGRPIRTRDVGPPAIVDRNDIVTLAYSRGTLTILTEGRSLGRGAAGDTVRVLNLASHKTLSGLIRADGTIEVK